MAAEGTPAQAPQTVRVTLKLYATLEDLLPADAEDHGVTLEVPAGTTPNELIDRFRVPRELAHLVLRNGVYLDPEERDRPVLADGDVIAIWPPVAGG